MTIRTATTNDITALRELYLELEKDGVRYQPEHFVIGTRTDEFFQGIFDSPTQDILVADENGEVHGADFIRTQVFPGNVDGMRFYERNGFCEMMKTIECQTLD